MRSEPGFHDAMGHRRQADSLTRCFLRMPVYKIAIAGASTLLSRELKDVLSESPLAESNFALLDEEEGHGQLEQVGDEVTIIQAIGAGAFDRADFTFFCGSENLTRRYWQQALRA